MPIINHIKTTSVFSAATLALSLTLGGCHTVLKPYHSSAEAPLSAAAMALLPTSKQRILVVAPVGSDFPRALAAQLSAANSFDNFTSITAALAAIAKDDAPATLVIAPGEYAEKIHISRNNLTIIGSGSTQTLWYFDDYAGRLGATGQTIGTAGSATVTISGKNIHLLDIGIANSFDFTAMEQLPAQHPKKVSGTQAVALYLTADSDQIRLDRVRLEGYQDTLYTDATRAHIRDSYISGHVDFIFGRGNLLIENSEIKTRARPSVNYHPHSFITAASTKIDQAFGITILNCRLTREPGVPDYSVALGRPWHPTTTFSDGRYADPFAKAKVIVANTWMDAHILPEGWYWMGGTAKDGTKVPMLPENARFFEFQSSGPGALVSAKRWQLSSDAAASLTAPTILSGW